MEFVDTIVAGGGCGSPERSRVRRECGLHQAARTRDVVAVDGQPRGLPNLRPEVVLSCRGLGYRFGEQVVLDDVWLDVRAGEAFGLVGSDGLARATMVRIVCGLLAAASGTVLLAGRPIDGPDSQPLQELVGYVAHDVAMSPSLTLAQNVRLWARLVGLSGATGRERALEVLALAGIERHGSDPIERCSAGVLREMSLAVALLRRPRLLVLDEPTRGIDPSSRERLLETLDRIRAGGTALFHASRSAVEVRQLCDQVGILDRGRLVTRGRPEEPRVVAA